MRVYPTLTIYFPESKDSELVAAMKAQAVLPWRWTDEFADGLGDARDCYIQFHRVPLETIPPCLLSISQSPGKFVVEHIASLAEPGIGPPKLSIDQYVRILRDFDALVAVPAAESVKGTTAMDTDRRTLEDYFSKAAIRLLQRFCETSNVSTLGSHPSDQQKWLGFLLRVHHEKAERVPCDTFGACLEAKEWWPDKDIPRLVHEYDFALELLALSDRTSDKEP
jgi:hypothetical protein